jgi:hypothetical protein
MFCHHHACLLCHSTDDEECSGDGITDGSPADWLMAMMRVLVLVMMLLCVMEANSYARKRLFHSLFCV